MSVQLASQLQALRDRGITNPDEFAVLDAETISQTVRWFDQQGDRVGPGVLVRELRNGGRKAAAKTDLLSREAQYGREIVAWLEQHVPDVCRTVWGPHPAAVTAVIRLHHVHGRTLKRSHVAQIRAAVVEWERKFGDDAEMAA